MKYIDCRIHERHERIIVDTEIGLMTVYDYNLYSGNPDYCTGQDDVSRTLELYGRWEIDETALTRKILEKGDRQNIFVDVGCHVGWFSRLAQQYDYTVVGYDANEENLKLFEENTNSKTVHKFFKEGTQIDEKFKGIEMLKIDIEGAEQFAIEAFKEFLPVTKNILMEVTPVFNDSYPALIKKLEGLGFWTYFVEGKPFDHVYDFNQTNLLFTK